MKKTPSLFKNVQAILKHVSYFHEKSMTLCSSFSKPGCSFLVGQLNETKRRLKTVDKQHLNILFINSLIYLVKDFNKEVICEVICRSDYMNPGGFTLRVRLEHQTSQRIL